MEETAVHFVIVLIIVERLCLSSLTVPVFHLERTIYLDGSNSVGILSREWYGRRTIGQSFSSNNTAGLLPPCIPSTPY
jgi:hypothetical protein